MPRYQVRANLPLLFEVEARDEDDVFNVLDNMFEEEQNILKYADGLIEVATIEEES